MGPIVERIPEIVPLIDIHNDEPGAFTQPTPFEKLNVFVKTDIGRSHIVGSHSSELGEPLRPRLVRANSEAPSKRIT